MNTMQSSAAHHPFLELVELAKAFGSRRVIDGVSLSIEHPQCMALLGLNGMGKSTLLRMIAGVLPPDSGKISICGKDMRTSPAEAKQSIGYLPENAPSYPGMRVIEILRFIAAIRRLPAETAAERIDDVLDTCGLQEVRRSFTDHLSKGYRHRLGLAQLLLHNPPVILLDEPTDGLDPQQKHSTRQLLDHLGKDHVVILSTHVMEDVREFCHSAIVLSNGKLTIVPHLPSDITALLGPTE